MSAAVHKLSLTGVVVLPSRRAYALPAQDSTAYVEGAKAAQSSASPNDSATRNTHPTTSHSLTTAPSDLTHGPKHPGSELLALLQSQERSMLQQGQEGSTQALSAAAGSLGQAHEQLMQSVVGSRQQEHAGRLHGQASGASISRAASSTPQDSTPLQAVQQLATRLQGDNVDAVRCLLCT